MNLKVLLFIPVFLFTLFSQSEAFDFGEWEAFLQKNVSEGSREGITLKLIDYEALRSDKGYKVLLNRLAGYNPVFSGDAEKKAFWINVYNIFAAKVVADNPGIKSIRDVGGWITTVWKKDAGKVGGRMVTLHEIEHEILRKMGDPRIHGAIVCASLSCPNITRDVYRAETLDAQLDTQFRDFLLNTSKGIRIDRKGKIIYLSRIFKWFEEDFESKGGVRKFLAGYLKPEDASAITNTAYSIKYMEYNWNLNSR